MTAAKFSWLSTGAIQAIAVEPRRLSRLINLGGGSIAIRSLALEYHREH